MWKGRISNKNRERSNVEREEIKEKVRKTEEMRENETVQEKIGNVGKEKMR